MLILEQDWKFKDSIIKELCTRKIENKDLKLLQRRGSQVIKENDKIKANLLIIIFDNET